MPSQPLVNITMPVWNRHAETVRSLATLRKYTRDLPIAVTVVDNGSEKPLSEQLITFHKDGIIDNLIILPRNMGVACAANIGWDAVDAPYYMKLDNDMLQVNPDFFSWIFKLWTYGERSSTIGPAWNPALFDTFDTIETPEGTLAICTTNVQGNCILIPKMVSDVLGYWSEDYDLYGAEDGDYGLRMNCAGLTQYLFDPQGQWQNLGASDPDALYTSYGIDRVKMHRDLFFREDGTTGLFRLNSYLYNLCLRSWKVPRRYYISKRLDEFRVEVEERPEYAPIGKALEKCRMLVSRTIVKGTEDDIFKPDVIDAIRKITMEAGLGG